MADLGKDQEVARFMFIIKCLLFFLMTFPVQITQLWFPEPQDLHFSQSSSWGTT